MSIKKVILALSTITLLLSTFACSKKEPVAENPLIFLVGETHGEPDIISKELELWQNYYKNEGFRHLFMEIGYVQELLLNEWMASDSNELLARMFEDLAGTAFYTQEEVDFIKEIKRTCPQTVFHGTDVGHQYKTTGVWYLEHMEKKELKDTEDYKLVIENNEQAKEYYKDDNDVTRENYMVENFIREYNKLPEGTKIMGIYGGAHTGLTAKNFRNNVDCMAKQLNKYYTKVFGECIISSENLSDIKTDREPLYKTTIEINGKEYEASYFGSDDIRGYIKDYVSRDFYRIESDKEDFMKLHTTLDYLPYNNYPTAIHVGDVYLIVFKKENGETEKRYYRADGKKKASYTITNNIRVK